MYTNDPINKTISYIHNGTPYPTEQAHDGSWPLHTWEHGGKHKFVLLFDVAGPWDVENLYRRTLPNGKQIPQRLRRKYIFDGPGTKHDVPACYRQGIRTEQCRHEDCMQMPFACVDPEHREGGWHIVVGGLNPFLRLVGETRPTPIHTTIGDTVTTSAAQPDLMAAIAAHPVLTPESAALARALARRAGAR